MGNKINMLVFSPYYPPHIGGLENHAEEFALEAIRHGHDITIWTANLPTGQRTDEIRNGIRVVRYDAYEILGGFPIPAMWKPMFWKQYRSLKNEGYTVVLSRTRFFLSSLLAHMFARKKHIPHVHVEHGSNYVHLNNSLANACAYLYDKTIGKYVLTHASAVVANSQATADFVRLCTKGVVSPTVIYRGINNEHIALQKPDIKQRSIDKEKVIVCYAGRLIDGKGVRHLIEALEDTTIQKRVVCWIVGDGKQRKLLERLAQDKKIADRVRFFGDQGRDQTISLIKASDIVINPSYTEGLPSSIIEAALCKKAIIATDVGGTREIIDTGSSGILIPSHSTKALVDGLLVLIENPMLREQYGNAAYKKSSALFSWDASMNSYTALFQRILSA